MQVFGACSFSLPAAILLCCADAICKEVWETLSFLPAAGISSDPAREQGFWCLVHRCCCAREG